MKYVKNVFIRLGYCRLYSKSTCEPTTKASFWSQFVWKDLVVHLK